MQLLFTTHESSIMDQAIFRRDEIWFVERNAENASSIYSLDRFKERYDKVLSKAYLEGRYGAIPVFSNISILREQRVRRMCWHRHLTTAATMQKEFLHRERRSSLGSSKKLYELE